jgi:hypothetical protein
MSLLAELHGDHERADAAHAEVEALGSRWLAEGALSNESTERLGELLEQLRSTYDKHIALEDHEVFPLAGQILSGADLLATGREMAERRSINLSALESNLNILSGADDR